MIEILLRRKEDKDKLLFMGRVLINIKGLDRIIAIMKKIIAIRPNIHLDIVGDGTGLSKSQINDRRK